MSPPPDPPPTDALVTYDLADGVARVTLANGDRGNPLNPASVAELTAAVERARTDDAHVVVLQSRGKSFCVGGDLVAFGQAPDPGRLVQQVASALHEVILQLHGLDAVVVSVVRGAAAGAGVGLAAAADLVLAGTSARFTPAYTRMGYSPDGGLSLLTASLGLHRTLHLSLLNPVLTAEQAQFAGLVGALHPDEDLEAAVDDVVRTLRAGSRSAQVATKRLVRQHATPDVADVLAGEATMVGRSAASPDGREGVRAFVDKRPPHFANERQADPS
jgi:2-(1,2-epoxy-1,2-dihydrophenyl)acetyl-CoA isomerase